ncbi:hypothetical protein [Pectobacterium versatile]|uniref:hypothetical protein n=1 Tax=Pectobacterium versatile TaxID=2488639 RepID=UPI002B24EEB0|nr:hypothetical protein [Pectobacterium versatile]
MYCTVSMYCALYYTERIPPTQECDTMKPYGQFWSDDGGTCSLCRSRGYRKGNGFDAARRASKHRARQSAQHQIKEQLP